MSAADAAVTAAAFEAPLSLQKLHALDALCKRTPEHVGALRAHCSADVIPALRALPAHNALRRQCIDVLQHWLEIGMVRTPVALPGTGFFVALQKQEAAAAATPFDAAAAAASATAPAALSTAMLPPQLFLSTDSRACAVCDSSCAVAFHDELNAWVFTDAVKMNAGKSVVHVECMEDFAE